MKINNAKIIFKELQYDEILSQGFKDITKDNTISFSANNGKQKIAVIYAPNGTGKTTLANLLELNEDSPNRSFVAADENGGQILPDSQKFHIIHDQLGRNLIKGSENEFLAGTNIQREFELRSELEEFVAKQSATLKSNLKTNYNINSKKIFEQLIRYGHTDTNTNRSTPKEVIALISSIISQSRKGNDLQCSQVLEAVGSIDTKEITPDKSLTEYCQFICDDLTNSEPKSAIATLFSNKLNSPGEHKESVEIEKIDVGITLLRDFPNEKNCVVCESDMPNSDELMRRKCARKESHYKALSKNDRNILEAILQNSTINARDPFQIKKLVRKAIETNNQTIIDELKNSILEKINTIIALAVNEFIWCFDDPEFKNKYHEYRKLVERDPDLDDDAVCLLEGIVNECLGRDLAITRDESSKAIKIELGKHEVLGSSREDLQLSTGEQNFISLSFEVLRARNQNRPYVVIDDPISSMDSIYANKIIFFFSKFLREEKKVIILTHSMDTIRLLHYQDSNSFNLYIMKNEATEYGFLEVSKEEVRALNDLSGFIKLLKDTDKLNTIIKDRKTLLIAMIPFMRGYAKVVGENKIFSCLSKLMHSGSESDSQNLSEIYRKLFFDTTDSKNTPAKANSNKKDICVGAEDVVAQARNILGQSVDIVDSAIYPLLDTALKNTLQILSLRIEIEETLIKIIPSSKKPSPTLGQIINSAFPASPRNNKNRAFFLSKLTTINQFSHYEGTLNIYQSALDISSASMAKEVGATRHKLQEIERKSDKK